MRARVCVCECSRVHGAFGSAPLGGDGLLQHTKQIRKGGWWVFIGGLERFCDE